MNPAQRNRTLALVRAGFEDGPALTVASTDGEIPQGRELSFAWLTGTVMTGLTSVLLMGAALYVSFQGQDTFSTAYEALQIVTSDSETTTDLINKTNRVRPITQTKSETEIVEASIKRDRRWPRPHQEAALRAHPRHSRHRSHGAQRRRAGLRSGVADRFHPADYGAWPKTPTQPSMAEPSRARCRSRPARCR